MMELYSLKFPNGKLYIGITSKTARRRTIVHRSHARTGPDCALHRAIRKYGEKSFSVAVLMVASDWNYLCEMERRAIASFGTLVPSGYNQSLGGEGVLGVPATEEARMRRSKAMKGKGLGNKFALGYRHTDDARRKIAAAGTGATFSDERRARIGATKIGNRYGAFKKSVETRAKISAAQIGIPKSDEARRNMSIAARNRRKRDPSK